MATYWFTFDKYSTKIYLNVNFIVFYYFEFNAKDTNKEEEDMNKIRFWLYKRKKITLLDEKWTIYGIRGLFITL
jgi:hypothetical protein